MSYKTIPKIKPDDMNKIINLSLPEYFDDYMKRRPVSKGGYIHLSKENFYKMIIKAKTEEEIKLLMSVYSNYIGHRNILP